MAPALYYLLACADDWGALLEGDETNNCTASGTRVQVALPDYVETSVTNPLGTANPGAIFSVTDTVLNQGVVASTTTSVTRYYLSLDTAKDSGDKLLTGSRGVPKLGPNAISTGTKNVTIPTDTT